MTIRSGPLKACRALAIATAVVASALAAGGAPATAGIDGCILSADKPGGSGTKAFGRFDFHCVLVAGVPLQYQVAVWERDAGPDPTPVCHGLDRCPDGQLRRLCRQRPIGALSDGGGRRRARDAVRTRIGSPPDHYATPWKSSSVLTTRTCQ